MQVAEFTILFTGPSLNGSLTIENLVSSVNTVFQFGNYNFLPSFVYKIDEVNPYCAFSSMCWINKSGLVSCEI